MQIYKKHKPLVAEEEILKPQLCPRCISVETREADNELTVLEVEPGGPASLRTPTYVYTSAAIHPEASSVKTKQRQRNTSIPVYTMETCDTTPFRAAPVAAVSAWSRRSGARELGDNVIDQVPLVTGHKRAVVWKSHQAAVLQFDL